MKVIIQIPCYNEQETLVTALDCLPKELSGVDTLEYLVIDDGSTDATSEKAKQWGVHHVIRKASNQGLARAFETGLEACLERGADIIVNTDADNQYNADDIPLIIEPVLNGQADIVIGSRPISETEHFSWTKKQLQRLGSWVVRKASGTDVADAPSGFRAISRDAAMRMNVFSRYTYTIETIIQAGQLNMNILSVPVRTNPDLRPSRLVKSIYGYVVRTMLVIFRIFMVYRPFRFFLILGSIPMLFGVLLGIRWLVLYELGDRVGGYPGVITMATLLLIGVQLWVLGLVSELMAANRRILEEIQFEQRQRKYQDAE